MSHQVGTLTEVSYGEKFGEEIPVEVTAFFQGERIRRQTPARSYRQAIFLVARLIAQERGIDQKEVHLLNITVWKLPLNPIALS